MRMKFTQKIHQCITFQATPSTCSCLQSFLPNKIENLSSWTSEVVSQVLTKGWRVGVGGVGWVRVRPQMEADHDWR